MSDEEIARLARALAAHLAELRPQYVDPRPPEPRPVLVLRPDLEEIDARLEEIRRLLREFPAVTRCALAGTEPGVLHHIVSLGARAAATKNLRTWLRGAERIVIADPYILHGETTAWKGFDQRDREQAERRYIDELLRVVPKCDALDVFHLPGPPRELANSIRKDLKPHVMSLRFFQTTEIHDRIWIRDGSDGRVVGTSFGGIGQKLCFMLPIPADDMRDLLPHLESIRQASR